MTVAGNDIGGDGGLYGGGGGGGDGTSGSRGAQGVIVITYYTVDLTEQVSLIFS